MNNKTLCTCMMARLAVFLLFSLMVHGGVSAEERWMKVHQPSAELRNNLPVHAIDYSSFIWMPEQSLPKNAGRRIERIDNPFAMTVDQESFDPQTRSISGLSEWHESPKHAQADFRLIQFNGPIKSEWLDELRRNDIQPIQYRHPYSYIVWAESSALTNSRSISSVRWSGEFIPAARVPAQDRQNIENHPHTMALVHAPTQAAAVNALRQAGVRVVINEPMNSRYHVLLLEAHPDRYLELATIPGVFTVQQIDQDAGPRGEMSNQSVVGGYNEFNIIEPGYLDWLNPTNLDGTDVIVGIVDGGIRETHHDLVDNIVDCAGTNGSCNSTNNDHGTHVAGAVGGTGKSEIVKNGFLRGQGIAPGVSMIEQLYTPFTNFLLPGGMVPNGMIDIYKDSADSNAVITNNSWGPTGNPQGYDIPTMQIDMITRDADPDTEGQQPVLPVWSIMNGGGDGSGDCAPSSLGSPDEAKNLFAVGSTVLLSGASQSSDIFSVSGNSAHGQACDGRQVPHIVAPGCRTDSTIGTSDVAHSDSSIWCGTSMASPIVSGSVALYFEQYRDDFGIDPSPALVKARFTAAAMNLVGNTDANNRKLGHRPDRMQGWGRLNLDAVINPSQPVMFIDQTEIFENTGEVWKASYEAADPKEPIRLMLAWTDAPGPGSGGTTPAWVNNLDLTVTIGQDIYYGNSISITDGFSELDGAPDEINNLEGVMLSPSQHQGAVIRIEVLAANLAGDGLDPWTPGAPRQDFALVCYNCIASIDFKDGFETPDIPD